MKFQKTLLAMAVTTALGLPAAVMAQPSANESTISATQQISAQAIRGQVTDHRGLSVQGAIVRLVGTSIETATDRQGRFRLEGLEPGQYQVSISYLGYSPLSTTVTVGSSAGQDIEVALRPLSLQDVDTIVVVGSRDGQARALNTQRASDNIKSVVSSDYLGRFPDANVAEAAQRLVGVSIQRDQGEGKYVNVRGAPREFSNVSINGVILPSPDSGTRAIDLDTIPADVISALELTKAITPAMDADAISGNINIVTQGALDAKGRVSRMNISGGRNEKGGGDAYRFGATYGDRLLGNENMGVLFSANHSETNRVTDNVEHDWFQRDDGVFLVEETEFKDYEVKRMRTGLSGRFDVRPTDNSHIFLTHTYSRFEDNEFRDTIGISWDRHTPESNATSGVAGRATFDNELRHRSFVNVINSTQLGGYAWFDGFEIDYSVAYSTASQEYPDRDYLIYRESSRPPVAYDFSNPDLPVYRVLDGDGNTVRSDFDFPYDSYNFRRYERRFGESTEKEQAYALNVYVPAQYGNIQSLWQFGGKARLKTKDNDQFRYRNGSGVGAPAFSDLVIDKQSRPFGGFYNNGPKLDRHFVRNYSGIFENADYKPRVAQSITSDYDASEDTYAAYGMNTLEWERTTVLLGLRVEQTGTAGTANEFDDDTETARPVQASNRYTEYFPSAHLRYELRDNMLVRAAYSTGLNRGNFEDLVPYFIIEDRESGFGSVDIGNVDLKPTYAHNLDLMFEYYIEPLGLFSAGVFYKDLRDPIFKSRSTFSGGEFDGFTMVRPENGSSGSLRGFEVNWQQGLDFLPGALAGLGFIANYTGTDSTANLPFGLGKTDLAGTSKHTYNLALQYDMDRISSQLSYNYRSAFIDSFDTSDPSLNVYWDERATLDLMTSYQATDRLAVFVEATNLTDTKAVRYQGDRTRVDEHEQFGRAWQIGLRANF